MIRDRRSHGRPAIERPTKLVGQRRARGAERGHLAGKRCFGGPERGYAVNAN